MPSFRVKYAFKGETPKLFKAIVMLGVANFVAFVALDETRALWRSQSTPFGMKVAAALSWYADQGLTIHFAILGVGFATTFLFYRDRMVRVPAAPTIGEVPASLFEVVIAATMAPAACGFVGALVAGTLFAEVDRVGCRDSGTDRAGGRLDDRPARLFLSAIRALPKAKDGDLDLGRDRLDPRPGVRHVGLRLVLHLSGAGLRDPSLGCRDPRGELHDPAKPPS